MRHVRFTVAFRATTFGLALALAATTPGYASPPGVALPGQNRPASAATGSGTAVPGTNTATHVVTLLTGDTVTVGGSTDGQRSYSVHPAERADRRTISFRGTTVGDDLYVVPSDAEPYLASGAVDNQLFNVTALVREGLADRARPLPLIVTYRGARTATTIDRATEALPAARRTLTLPVIGGAALRVDQTSAAAFWEGIDVDGPAARAGKLDFQRGVSRVWLDRQVHTTLDQSVPQIGAPTAWDAGVDGTGVKVAVLDTGIDATHPDFAGRIGATRDFSGSPSTEDKNGHGTHVASTIAGSGAASDGQFRGVAPGATLLAGKVLGDNGTGSSSWIIAGMQWAAEQGARVINVSLSADLPSDYTDPLSVAVDDVSRRYGVLVVAAAGNKFNVHTVYAPAAAKEALAVGAVDKSDQLANFSSRGPGLTDGAVKPEITAPGVGIVAARAKDTNLGPPVGDSYTRLDGTSMAAPHVAGAAVLLAAAHPSWTGSDIRRALVSTAVDGGTAWFQQGAGRVDVARAFTQGVYGSSALNFGDFPFPQSGTATRQATFTNDTDTDVTLAMSLDVRGWAGAPAPADAVRLGASSLTVPAHGQASVDVTVDPTVGPNSVYGGVLSANSADGTVRLRTPLSWLKSPESQDVTVRVTDSHGKPVPFTRVLVARVDFPDVDNPFADPFTNLGVVDGVGHIRLPRGTYYMHALVDEVNLQSRRSTLAIAPEVSVPGTGDVVLDARRGELVRPQTPESTQDAGAWIGASRTAPSGQVVVQEDTSFSMRGVAVYVTPTAPVRIGQYAVYDRWALHPPLLDARVSGRRSTVLHPEYDPVLAAPKLAGNRTLPVTFVGQGRPEDFAAATVRGRLALVRLPAPDNSLGGVFDGLALAQQVTANAAEAGAAGVLVYLDLPGALPLPMPASDPILELSLGHSEGEALRAAVDRRGAKVSLRGEESPARVYQLRYDHIGGISQGYRNVVNPRSLAVVKSRYHSDQPGLADFESWHSHSAAFPSSAVVVRGFWVPTAATELVAQPRTPGFFWDRWVFQTISPTAGSSTFLQRRVLYPPGRPAQSERWFESPIHKGMPESLVGDQIFCSMCRDVDWLVPPQYEMDTNAEHGFFLFDSGAGSTMRLFRGSTEIPVDTSRGYPRFALAPEPDVYRLDLHEQQRATDIRTLAPTIDTSWTFRSARPADGATLSEQYLCRVGRTDPCAFQPMIQLGYQLGLDLLNQAPADDRFRFQIRAGVHSGVPDAARVVGMTVSASTDGERSWQKASVRRAAAGRFGVTVAHPRLDRTDGFVSLRVEAWDGAGNRVVQTVHRAYALSGHRAG